MRQRKRRKKGRGGSHWLEDAGHATLAGAWSLCVTAVRVVVGSLLDATRGAWHWLRRQELWLQVVAVVIFATTVSFLVSAAMKLHPSDFYISEEEALARVIRSEIGIGTRQEQVHVAWATRNLAAKHRKSIARLACSPCGPQERGRPVSSAQDATAADRKLARAILEAPEIIDPTGGATQFINPRLQDQLAKRGTPGYRGRSYRVVSRKWRRSYGWERYYRLSPTLELWGEKRR